MTAPKCIWNLVTIQLAPMASYHMSNGMSVILGSHEHLQWITVKFLHKGWGNESRNMKLSCELLSYLPGHRTA